MGLCTANARRPTVDSSCRGTTISCCAADLRRCLPTTSVTGMQVNKVLYKECLTVVSAKEHKLQTLQTITER